MLRIATYLCFVSFLLNLFSCARENQRDILRQEGQNIAVRHVDIPMLTIDSFLTAAENVTPLKGVYLNRVVRSRYSRGQFFFFDKNDYDVTTAFYAFSQEGERLYSIDYANPFIGNLRYVHDFFIHDGRLIFSAPITNRLLVFNTQGQYDTTYHEVPAGLRLHALSSDKFLFHTGSKTQHQIGTETNHYVFNYDLGEEHVEYSFSNIPPVFASMSLLASPTFFPAAPKGEVLVSSSNYDTIYACTEEAYHAKYIIDWPGSQTREKQLADLNRKAIGGRTIPKDEKLAFFNNDQFIGDITFMTETSTHLLVSYNYGGRKQYFLLFDREKEKARSVQIDFISNPFNSAFFNHPSDDFIFFVHSAPEQIAANLQETADFTTVPSSEKSELAVEKNPIIFTLRLPDLIDIIEKL